uniref:Uncharacterized protein n=1 Tax=Echeneis naucrates TaxID=173247 RepID=A0A665WMS6_ECHNA
MLFFLCEDKHKHTHTFVQAHAHTMLFVGRSQHLSLTGWLLRNILSSPLRASVR